MTGGVEVITICTSDGKQLIVEGSLSEVQRKLADSPGLLVEFRNGSKPKLVSPKHVTVVLEGAYVTGRHVVT